jgi:hypothetical protein
METLKVQVKLFSRGTPDVPGYAAVFQRWIRDHVLDELLIDVVDYSHVPEGPAVALIGHESDYVLDRAGGKLGLLYAAKRNLSSAGDAFLRAIKRAMKASLLLERDPGPKTRLDFRSDEILLRIADRLNAPNTDETFERLAPVLRDALSRVYEATPFTLTRVGSPRELFSVTVHAPTAPPFDRLAIAEG